MVINGNTFLSLKSSFQNLSVYPSVEKKYIKEENSRNLKVFFSSQKLLYLKELSEVNRAKVLFLPLTYTVMTLNKSLLMHCLVRYSLSTAKY